MINGNIFRKAINEVMRAHGFTRKSSTWYQWSDEVIAVFNLQRSTFGNTYFLNIGFFLRASGAVDYPKEHDCHLRSRAEGIWPEEQLAVIELDNNDQHYLDDEVFLSELKCFIDQKVVALLLEGLAIPGLLAMLQRFREFRDCITVDGKHLLGFDDCLAGFDTQGQVSNGSDIDIG